MPCCIGDNGYAVSVCSNFIRLLPRNEATLVISPNLWKWVKGPKRPADIHPEEQRNAHPRSIRRRIKPTARFELIMLLCHDVLEREYSQARRSTSGFFNLGYVTTKSAGRTMLLSRTSGSCSWSPVRSSHVVK